MRRDSCLTIQDSCKWNSMQAMHKNHYPFQSSRCNALVEGLGATKKVFIHRHVFFLDKSTWSLLFVVIFFIIALNILTSYNIYMTVQK